METRPIKRSMSRSEIANTVVYRLQEGDEAETARLVVLAGREECNPVFVGEDWRSTNRCVLQLQEMDTGFCDQID